VGTYHYRGEKMKKILVLSCFVVMTTIAARAANGSGLELLQGTGILKGGENGGAY
jgi:hypothetical protein